MTKRIIGIDFGKTIGKIEDVPNLETFNVIKMLIQKYDSDNLFIVSKAGQEMQQKIKQWLDKYKFYDITGFDINNIYFVKEYTDKKEIIKKLKINVFIDDHHKVIQSIVDLDQLDTIIWFSKDANIKLIPIKYKYKVRTTINWNKIWNYSWNK